MPSPNRFVLPHEGLVVRFRRRPLAVAAMAATGGLLCGALVMSAFGGPGQPAGNTVAAGPAVASLAVASDAKPDDRAAAECREQTWPYIARSCLTEAKPQTRGVRVVSTDRLTEPTIGAIETSSTPKQAAEPSPAASAASVAATQPPPAANPPEVIAAIKALGDPPNTDAPASTPVVVASIPASQATPAESAAKPLQAEKPQVAEKPRRSREAKPAPRKPLGLKPETETVASATDDEDDSGRRVVQSRDSRGRHIVQRWIERDYRNEDGRTQRVIVAPRPASIGIFGGIFGGADSYAARDDD